jgi:hypothetical protein
VTGVVLALAGGVVYLVVRNEQQVGPASLV